jgi:glutamate-5-semialdehyde dehydrogenase
MSRVSLKKMGAEAKKASGSLALATTEQKNRALSNLAKNLEKRASDILKANQADIELAQANGLSESMIDRLSLKGRLEGIIGDIDQVISLPDPIGELFDQTTLPNGLECVKCRTPIGVIGIIYESRPNVTIDVSTLCIKTGNCAILRGGSETFHTNQILVKIIQESLAESDLPPTAIQSVPSTDRTLVKKLLHLYELIDLIIPRGGASLHDYCRQHSKIPVITGGIGICHLFVDETAKLKPSLEVILNAKTQRPTVCNALDTLLVHEKIAPQFIPEVIAHLKKSGVVFRLDHPSYHLLKQHDASVTQLATEDDWDKEWLSLVLGIRVVQNLDEAIQHIAKHSTGHSDGILTETKAHAEAFLRRVDSAAVYVNASTRFTDGGQLGLGAEVAISTQKLHARGPMGLQELTTYKWIIRGNYTVRA